MDLERTFDKHWSSPTCCLVSVYWWELKNPNSLVLNRCYCKADRVWANRGYRRCWAVAGCAGWGWVTVHSVFVWPHCNSHSPDDEPHSRLPGHFNGERQFSPIAGTGLLSLCRLSPQRKKAFVCHSKLQSAVVNSELFDLRYVHAVNMSGSISSVIMRNALLRNCRFQQ